MWCEHGCRSGALQRQVLHAGPGPATRDGAGDAGWAGSSSRGNDAGARALLAAGAGRGGGRLKGQLRAAGLDGRAPALRVAIAGLAAGQAETPRLDEALARVAERAARTPEGGWVLGYGWNHNAWGGELPSAADLDPASRPATRSRGRQERATPCGSTGVRWPWPASAPERPTRPAGGSVRDAAGRPTGSCWRTRRDWWRQSPGAGGRRIGGTPCARPSRSSTRPG